MSPEWAETRSGRRGLGARRSPPRGRAWRPQGQAAQNSFLLLPQEQTCVGLNGTAEMGQNRKSRVSTSRHWGHCTVAIGRERRCGKLPSFTEAESQSSLTDDRYERSLSGVSRLATVFSKCCRLARGKSSTARSRFGTADSVGFAPPVRKQCEKPSRNDSCVSRTGGCRSTCAFVAIAAAVSQHRQRYSALSR
jgi:hypothetical protein